MNNHHLNGSSTKTIINGLKGYYKNSISINTEFININSIPSMYNESVGLASKITEKQLIELINYTKGHNYYNVYTYNCATYASEAWNYIFGINRFKPIGTTLIYYPSILWEEIYKDRNKIDSYETQMIRIILNKLL